METTADIRHAGQFAGIGSPTSEVYLMDCMEGMRQYPDNHFDLAVVDPPYGIGADKQSVKPTMCRQKNGNLLTVKNTNQYTQKNWDSVIPDEGYFKELFRVSKNQIIFGGNYFGLKGGYIIWDKLNGECDQYGCELAWNSFNSRTDVVYYMWQGMFQGVYCGKDIRRALKQQGNKKLNENRIHPTQKPVALYDWIFHNYAKQGDLIIDTHLGSGSSRIAADKAGLSFVGFEIDKEYFDAANKRFDNYKSQLRMF